MLRSSNDGEPIIKEWFLKKVRTGVITERTDENVDFAAAEQFDQL